MSKGDDQQQDGKLDVSELISVTFKGFDEEAKKLELIPQKAKKNTTKLLSLFSENKDIFKQQTVFLEAINQLSEEIGHAYYTVLAIELKREMVTPLKPSDFAEFFSFKQPSNPSSQPPINIQTSTPQLGVFSGGWHFLAERRKAIAIERIAKQTQQSNAPPLISTSKQAIDILDFGRQLIPEFNRIQEFYQKCVDHLYFFDDKETRERLTAELRKHINKIAGIIRAFCRTITEYRKELIGDRKADVAKAAYALQMAYEAAKKSGAPFLIDGMGKLMTERTGK